MPPSKFKTSRKSNAAAAGRPPIPEEVKLLCSSDVDFYHAGPRTLRVERPTLPSEAVRAARESWAAAVPELRHLPLKTRCASLVSTVDYGAQSSIHDYHHQCDPATGMAYGFEVFGAMANAKPDRQVRKDCKRGVAGSKWMLIILLEMSLCITFGIVLSFTRFMVVRGANTRKHTDTWRGGEPAAMRLVDDTGGRLHVDTSIHFRRSLCTHPEIDGYCCPLMLNPNGLLLLYWLADGSCCKTLLPGESWTALRQEYLLDCIVFGTKGGMATSAPIFDAANPHATLISSTKQAVPVTLQQLRENAKELQCSPGTHVAILGSCHHWELMLGWCFVHWWVGDPSGLRVHAFSCALRQVPMGSLKPREEAPDLPDGHFEETQTRNLTSGSKWNLIPHDQNASHTVCQVCGSGDEIQGKNEILICSDCEHGCMHMACCKPALLEVPVGRWYCGGCTSQREEAQKLALEGQLEQSGAGEVMCELERERLKNIERNEELLRQLGLM